MTNSQSVLSKRANVLAERIIYGADSLADFVKELSDSDWHKPVIGDGRTVGVFHHVASTYPLEIELAQVLASGKSITEATMDVVDQMNAAHAQQFANVEKREALELLVSNSRTAAEKVREFTDDHLDNSGTVSLNENAPLTAQFFIEDHALRHSYHHLARIQNTLEQ